MSTLENKAFDLSVISDKRKSNKMITKVFKAKNTFKNNFDVYTNIIKERK